MLERYRLDSCVAATRIALDVLASVGIADAYPLSVIARIYNAAFQARAGHEGRVPDDQAELARWFAKDGSHCIELGFDGDARPDRWPGHLVAIVNQRWLWDLSLDQVDDPERGIRLPGPLALPVAEPFLRGRELVIGHAADVLLVYEARPADKSFKVSPNWRSNLVQINVTRAARQREYQLSIPQPT